MAGATVNSCTGFTSMWDRRVDSLVSHHNYSRCRAGRRRRAGTRSIASWMRPTTPTWKLSSSTYKVLKSPWKPTTSASLSVPEASHRYSHNPRLRSKNLVHQSYPPFKGIREIGININCCRVVDIVSKLSRHCYEQWSSCQERLGLIRSVSRSKILTAVVKPFQRS